MGANILIDSYVLPQMFLGTDNVAVLLVKEGLAKVDEYAQVARELTDAQDEAKNAKKNVSRPLSLSHPLSFLISFSSHTDVERL